MYLLPGVNIAIFCNETSSASRNSLKKKKIGKIKRVTNIFLKMLSIKGYESYLRGRLITT